MTTVLLLLTALAAAAVAPVVWALQESVPDYEGAAPVPGLVAPAVLLRDSEGLLTVRAESLEDAARGVGFAPRFGAHGADGAPAPGRAAGVSPSSSGPARSPPTAHCAPSLLPAIWRQTSPGSNPAPGPCSPPTQRG